MKKITIGLGAIIIILAAILLFVPFAKSPDVSQTAGSGIASSSLSADKHLRISLPLPDQIVSSPTAIEGTVTSGGWFFESNFPIQVLDDKGKVIGSGQATALSDWKSLGAVPFSASITFTAPAPQDTTGTIVFSKADPSHAPWDMESLALPVRFR